MKAFLALTTTILALPAAFARPVPPPVAAITTTTSSASGEPGHGHLTVRGFFANAVNGAKGKGIGGNQQQAVTGAASSFAGDVAIVSASLNGMGATTDAATTRSLARKAFVAEKDEDQHRAVLNGAAGGDAARANQKIVDNTPIVLDGLQSIMTNPGMANTMRNLATIERARNANILPSITQLSNSAFQQAGVNQQAKQFDPTSGTQALRTLQASGAN